jgi:transcriptional regulator PpsR
MTPFAAPEKSLGSLSARAAGQLVAAAADVALILDAEGVIRDMAFGSDSLKNLGYDRWVGQPWIQTVTKESRPKIEALLRDADAPLNPRWRQVNHPSEVGSDLPLAYCALKVDDDRTNVTGHSVVYGRDLRAMAAMQQSLVDAQQEALHEHWRLRDAQSRYRHLFQGSPDAVLIIDSASQKVLEANPAANELFADVPRKLVGSVFPFGFDDGSNEAAQGFVAALRSAGKVDGLRVRLSGSHELTLSGSMFRQEQGSLLILRLSRVVEGSNVAKGGDALRGPTMMSKLMQGSPDCVVVTDIDGSIVSVNEAFVGLAQVASDKVARGEPLSRWLGRTGVEMNVLVSTLRQRGSVRLFPTVLRGEQGAPSDVEVSATMVTEDDRTYLGFTIRDVSRRLSADARAAKELPRSVGQLSELVGRVPMKDIVGETTDLIEQLCIEAALDLTRDNRAAAAEMLGLSRQSLYVKLRRYGLSDPVAESEK